MSDDKIVLCSSDISTQAVQDLPTGPYRVLIAIYKMVDGRTDVSVTEEEVEEEVERSGILTMSDEEFEQYRRQVFERIMN